MTSDDPASGGFFPVGDVRVVDDELHGTALGDFLIRCWPAVDRVFLRNLVLGGNTRVNGAEPRGLRQRLRAGDVIQVVLPGPVQSLPKRDREAAVDLPAVLYEDAEVLVVPKASGEPCLPDKAGKYDGVLGAWRAARNEPDLQLVERQDREVSGVLLLARSRPVLARLAGIAEGVSRYTALVTGVVARDETRVDRPLGPDPRRPGRIAVVSDRAKGRREAITCVQVVERFRSHTLVAATAEVARNHQVRVHLAHLGHPVVADRDYGISKHLLLSQIKRDYKARRGVVERPLLTRMFLHVDTVAWRTEAGDERSVSAPLPDDLSLVLTKLRSFAKRRS